VVSTAYAAFPLAAGAGTGGGTDPTSLIQFGVLGVLLALILAGFLWAKPAVDALKERLRRAEELIDTTLKATVETLRAVVDGLERNNTTTRDVADRLSELEKAFREDGNRRGGGR
jgi:hypothetical protein